MGIENHKVPVIRITELFKHPNADSLSIVKVGGYQVVVRTEDFHVGDLAYYIQPDSVVPERPEFKFLWADNEFLEGEVPVKKRRITVRRFRKEMSEGMLMPCVRLPSGGFALPAIFGQADVVPAIEGRDAAEYLGITHYEPPEEPENTRGDNERGPGGKQNKLWPRSLKGWLYFLPRVLTFGLWDPNGKVGGANMKAPDNFRPIYDVEALKNFVGAFEPGEPVVVTEKIHGSNARYTFENGKFYAGSRKLWKSPKSSCIWRKVAEQHPWIEDWCRRHEGYTLYGEVVPTQKGFNYGCKDGETKFFVFDIRRPNGQWVNRLQPFGDGNQSQPEEIPMHSWVPEISTGPFMEMVRQLADGRSYVDGADHIREGIVIRPVVEREIRNLGRLQLKIVSSEFLLKDSK